MAPPKRSKDLVEPLSPFLVFFVRGVRNTVIRFSILKFAFSYFILHDHSSVTNLVAFLAKADGTAVEDLCFTFNKM
jgi:hypothetical protein